MGKGPGRPKLPKNKAKGDILSIRLTPGEKIIYEKLAQEQGITLAAWIRFALQAAAQHGIKNGEHG